MLDIISRSKEGGCFVYFNDMSNAKSALELIRQKRKLVGRKVEAYIVKVGFLFCCFVKSV